MYNNKIDQLSLCGLHIARRLLLSTCLITTVLCGVHAAEKAKPESEESREPVAPFASLEQSLGIQVSSVNLSGGGNLVDFRYRVLDPVKAAALTKPEIKPLLTDENTGAKLQVPTSPKVGPLRQTSRQPVAGKTYFMLFANTQHHVKSGDKVTVSVGDYKVANLTVE